MVPTPKSGIYHMHSNYIIIILQFTEYDSKKKTLPDNRSQCGAYPGKWHYGQLLITKLHCPCLIQTHMQLGSCRPSGHGVG